MKRSIEKQVLKFLGYLKELEVIEAVGLARFLHVDLLIREDDSDPDNHKTATITEKEYDIILSEMIDAFISSNREKRKMILELMENATSK